jgi:hypothetical protein
VLGARVCSWRWGGVVGGAGESMKGGNDEVVTWGAGETARRGDVGVWKCSPELDACPHVPSPEGEGQEEGWGTGKSEGVGGAGGEVTLVTLGRWSRYGCRR